MEFNGCFKEAEAKTESFVQGEYNAAALDSMRKCIIIIICFLEWNRFDKAQLVRIYVSLT